MKSESKERRETMMKFYNDLIHRDFEILETKINKKDKLLIAVNVNSIEKDFETIVKQLDAFKYILERYNWENK